MNRGEAASPEALKGIAVTVSGLVVGKNTDGEIAAGGSYAFSGEGGLTADKASAHGIYVDTTNEDDIDFDGREVAYQYDEFDELTLSYAVTIHKSQGSEYPCVVMPIHAQHYMMLRRNLSTPGSPAGSGWWCWWRAKRLSPWR